MLKKLKKRQQERQEPIIFARVTQVSDVHVCIQCGKDASLLYVSYENMTPVQTQQAYEEGKRQTTLDGVARAANTSLAEMQAAIYEATIQEQRQGLPQEHSKDYRCYACMSWLISTGTGIPGFGEVAIARLLQNDPGLALFAYRREKKKKLEFVYTPFHEIEKAVNKLKNMV